MPDQDPFAAIATPVAPQQASTPPPSAIGGGDDPFASVAKPIPEGLLHSIYSGTILPAVSYAVQHPGEAAKNVGDVASRAIKGNFTPNPDNPIDKMVIDQVHSTAAHLKQAGKDVMDPESWKHPVADSSDIVGQVTRIPSNVRRDVVGAIPVAGQTLEKAQGQYENDDLGGAVGTLLAPVAQAGLDELPGAIKTSTGKLINAAKKVPEDFQHAVTGTTTGSVRDMARKVQANNEEQAADTAKANAAAQAAHEANLDVINAKNDKARAMAVERSKQLHDEAANAIQAVNDVKDRQHSEAVQDIVQQNAAEEEAAAKATDENLQKAQTQHASDVADAAETEGTRGELARRAIELKNRISQNVQRVAANVKGSLDQRFQAVRDAVEESGVGEAPAAPLSSVAEAQTKRLGETGDKVAQFKDIVARAKSDSAAEEAQAEVSQSTFGRDYDNLTDGERKIVDEHVQQTAPPDADPATFTYSQLRRISSKLGSQAFKLSGVDDFLASSIRDVKRTADAMATKMADEAKVGTEHRNLMKDWAEYKSTFHEPTGPSGSGSQVAQSLNAEDVGHATAPFEAGDEFAQNRAKQLLVGRPVEQGGLYHNPQGGRLVDALREVRNQQAELPKKLVEVKPFEEPEPVEPKLTEPPDRPEEKQLTEAKIVRPGDDGIPALQSTEPPVPKEPNFQTMTPEELRTSLNRKVTDQIAKMRDFQAGNWAKIITGATTIGYGLAKYLGDMQHAGWAVGLGAAGIATVMGWKMMGRMLDSEAVIKQLSEPTLAQYREVMRLPPEQRLGVEEIIRNLDAEGRRTGKLKAESPWIRAFNTFLKVGTGQAATKPSEPVEPPPGPAKTVTLTGEYPFLTPPPEPKKK